MRLVLASNNPHKLSEFSRLLAGCAPDIDLRSPAASGATLDYVEAGDTYLEHALGKARQVSDAMGAPALADDSGLEVSWLGGAPGVRSARYGPPGASLDDDGRTAYLLEQLTDAADRRARFVCCLALVLDVRRFVTVQATVDGWIARHASGAGGFGYDPVFEVEQNGRTMAELPAAEKDAISHRGRALRSCIRALQVASGALHGE